MVADVDQSGRLVGRMVGDRSEFHLDRVDQRTRNAATRPVRAGSVVPAEHGAQDVVRPCATDHVRDERVSGDQPHIVRHLNPEKNKS